MRDGELIDQVCFLGILLAKQGIIILKVQSRQIASGIAYLGPVER